MPDHRHREEEYPYVGYEVGDVGEVGEGDHFETFARYVGVPVGGQRAASKEERDCDTYAPCEDEGGGREDDAAEDRVDKDSVVEGEDREFDADEREVVEVAEDVVAFSDHHLVVCGYDNDMSAHAMRRTKTQPAGAFSDQAECRKQDQIVVQGNPILSVSFRPNAHACAHHSRCNGYTVHPVNFGDARVVFMRLEVGQFCWRERRRHLAALVVSRGRSRLLYVCERVARKQRRKRRRRVTWPRGAVVSVEACK